MKLQSPVATLEIFLPSFKDPFTYQLRNPVYTLGRHPGCDIVIDAKTISRIHCTFVWRYDGEPFYQLIDGDRSCRKPSSNGVFVNTHRVEEIWARLSHNDEITFGASTVKCFYRQISKGNTIDRSKETSGGGD